MPEDTGFNFTLDTSGLSELIHTTPEKLDRWLAAVAEEMVTEIKLSMGTSEPGYTYIRGNVTHTASQPGYPPNVDTGTLRASIVNEADGVNRQIIHDQVNYGVFLEMGTENIYPRPFIGPVFEIWSNGKLQEYAKSSDILGKG